MADAYCGPSNALQNFQKHSSVDRTLQQDRLSARRSPLENFRSPEQNAGLLDPEFEAFQASQPGPLPFAEPAALPFPQSLNQRGKQPVFGGPVGGSDWATDFQRLQLSSPSPQQQHASQAAQFRSSPSIQSGAASPAFRQQAYANTSYQSRFQGGYGEYGSYGGLNRGFMQQNMPTRTQHQPVQQSHDIDMFDEAAFERAFDAAKEQILAEELANQAESTNMDPQRTAYPYLPILRLSLVSSLLNPTEPNMHQAALYFSLLEKHDISHIDPVQLYVLKPTLDFLASSDNLPYSDRYDLQRRATNLRADWKLPQDLDDQARKMAIRTSKQYTWLLITHDEKLQASQTQRPLSSAADEEMRDDVEMQLNRLQNRDIAERVFEVITTDTVNNAKEALGDVLGGIIMQNELRMMRSEMKVDSGADAFRELYMDSRNAAFSAEVVERRDMLAANRGEGFEHRLNELQSLEEIMWEKAEAHRSDDQKWKDLQNMEDRQWEEAVRAMPDPDLQEEMQDASQNDDNDDLARTAGELLSKVSDNTSTKFQNSNFLDLMRRLRDREVRVEGDRVVETSQMTESLDGAKPDYVPPAPLQESTFSNLHTVPMDGPLNQRDGEDVVRLLDEPSTLDQGDTFRLPQSDPSTMDEADISRLLQLDDQ